ncbi:MAG TPA: hypothetical protein VKT80_14710, partial [Chloroflexota bacterium]|nr:hypothetical protein [Chloroflexota bacterium]
AGALAAGTFETAAFGVGAFDAGSLTLALPFVGFFTDFEDALFGGAFFDVLFAAGRADARADLTGFFDFGAGLEDLNADAPDRRRRERRRCGRLAGRE